MGSPDDERFERYLLGELPEKEQTRLEQEFFTDPDTLQRVASAEDDLIDEYVDGRLEGDRRARFERRMASSPERRQRIEFARQLARYGAAHPAETAKGAFVPYTARPIVQLAMAAALLIAVGTSAWMALELRQVRRELARAELDRLELARREQALAATLAEQRRAAEQPSPKPPASPVVALSLLPGIVRSPGGATRVVVPATAALVRLELRLPEGSHQDYRVDLETARGRGIWNASGLRPSTSAGITTLILEVPAKLLAAGNYVVMVTGRPSSGEYRDVAGYSFSVANQ